MATRATIRSTPCHGRAGALCVSEMVNSCLAMFGLLAMPLDDDGPTFWSGDEMVKASNTEDLVVFVLHASSKKVLYCAQSTTH